MNENQITEFALMTTKEIAALWESSKSAHKRIDENDKVTSGIHKLSASIAGMTAEMKGIADRMDESNTRMTVSIDKMSAGQRAQGERIGSLENALFALSKLPESIDKLSAKVEAIEKEPSTKWKKFTWLIVAGVATAVITFLMARLL